MSKLRACIDKFEGVISLSDKNKLLAFREDAIQDGRSEEEADTLAVIRFNDLLIKELNGLKLQLKLPTQPLSSAIMKRREKEQEINKKYDALEKLQEESFQFELKDSDLEYLIDKGYDNAAIIKAIKEANRILKLPTEEIFKELQKVGVFNLGKGEKFDVRPNVGLSTEEYNNTMKQLNSGKETKTIERLMDYVKDLKKSGELKIIQGVGGASEKYNLPLYFNLLGEQTNAERGLSEIEEKENLEKLELQKQYEESLQKPKKDKSLSAIQQDAIKALEAGQYVYVQNEQDEDFIVEFTSADEIINYDDGMGDIQISDEEIDGAVPYSQIEKKENKDVQKVVERMQKVLPKFKISYDDKLNAAGKIKGNQITINPFYAGKDTPIHEAGHALIDFIGYKDKVIQKAIEQLKSTPLWAETKQRYPELSEEMLGKEVLAEAIGLEGAGLFDTEVEKRKFKVLLDYIYTKLKQLLGIDKNIAKSLAKQIIGGVGTKDIDVKPKKETKAIFDKSVQLFYKIKDAEGAAKKRTLAEQRRALLEANPSIKYIEDNIKSIYKQLEQANKLIKEGDCI